jgi:predicted nuclease of predicted toxin-antitoxin system
LNVRILADENVPRLAAERLRAMGHGVAWVRTDAPGSSDAQVIARADREQRILLTHDKGFGDLAFRAGLPAACGVVLLRIDPQTPVRVVALVEKLFSGDADFTGDFVVVEEGRVRRRRLPGAT